MKRIITLLAIMLTISSASLAQFTDSDRSKINIGDYTFMRTDYDVRLGYQKGNGRIWYSYSLYGMNSDEAIAVKQHIERNLDYYQEKYNGKIVVSVGEMFSCFDKGNRRHISIVIEYNDWVDEYNRAVEEKKNKDNLARNKRLESINW